MILINRPMPNPLPKETKIFLSDDHKDIIVQTPRTDIQALIKEVEQFIDTELEKAKKQQQKYNTIVETLTEAKGKR